MWRAAVAKPPYMFSPFRNAVLIASALLTFPVVATAGGKPPPRKEFKPPYDVVSAVNLKAGTVTVKHVNSTDTKLRLFKIDGSTEVQINGNPGSLQGIHAGMKVDVTMGMDDSRAERLVLSPGPPTPPPKPKK